MERMRSLTGAAWALVFFAVLGPSAQAADVLKIAVGQCGNWDSSPIQLGDGAGIYAKHGITIEAVCTQGTGETQQAVISGSADVGHRHWHARRARRFCQGRADPHHLGQRDRQRRLLVRQGGFAAEENFGRDRSDHHRLFDQRLVHPRRGARPHSRARPQGQADGDRRARCHPDGGAVGAGRHRLDLAAARLRHARRRPHPHFRPRQ